MTTDAPATSTTADRRGRRRRAAGRSRADRPPRRRARPGPGAHPGHRRPSAGAAAGRARDDRRRPAGCPAPIPTSGTPSCSTARSAGSSTTTGGRSTCGCAACSRRWPELVGDEVGAALHAGVVRRRQARGPHRLDRLGDPAAAARPDRRPPPQRGARSRHGGADRGARTAPADAGRRAPARPATAAGRATPTAEPPGATATSRSRGRADVWGPIRPPDRAACEGLHEPLRTIFCSPHPPPPGRGRGTGALTGIMASWSPAPSRGGLLLSSLPAPVPGSHS